VKRSLPFVLAVLGIAAAAALYYFFLFGMQHDGVPLQSATRPTSVPDGTSARLAPTADGSSVEVGRPQRGLRVVATKGRVDVQVPGQQWRPLAVGDVLRPRSSVRTYEDGEALLAAANLFTVSVRRGSFVTIADNPFQVLVASGSVDTELLTELPAEARGGLRIATVNGDSAAVLQRPGAVRVITDGRGTTTAIALKGAVVFFSHGKAVTVATGSYSSTSPTTGAPTAPLPVSSSLLWNVTWPQTTAVNKPTIAVDAEADPGTRFFFKGRVVVAGPDRHVRAIVPLREGANTIHVEVEDVNGRTYSATSPDITCLTKNPKYELEVSPDIWNEH
jgi:hypothetical protein